MKRGSKPSTHRSLIVAVITAPGTTASGGPEYAQHTGRQILLEQLWLPQFRNAVEPTPFPYYFLHQMNHTKMATCQKWRYLHVPGGSIQANMPAVHIQTQPRAVGKSGGGVTPIRKDAHSKLIGREEPYS